MIIKLKDHVIEDIRDNGYFVNEGCACGDFFYQLSDSLWLNVYRSCRKSSGTPGDKLWHLHEIQFYDDVKFNYFEYEGDKLIGDIEEYGNFLEDVKLNTSDKEILFEILRVKTIEIWGNEHRNNE